MKSRSIIITLSLLISCWSIEAQEMSVEQFRLLETDLTANTCGTERLDQFGNKAALIKIIAPLMEGYTFDGGGQGIVGSEQKGGEIWLYVPAGAQHLTIRHRLFGTLRNYAYPISIQAACTYEMLLDIGTGRFVTITGSQANADIEVDGKYVGHSPVMHYYLSYGRHSLRATNDNQEGSLQMVLTSNDSLDAPVYRIEMQSTAPRTGSVFLTVDNDAAIYFRGEHVGNGSWRTQLREGDYEVETRDVECEPTTTTFTVKAGQENQVIAQAPKPQKGHLGIITQGRKMKAWLDEEPFPTDSIVELPVGTHEVEMKGSMFRRVRKEYLVEYNKVLTDTVRLRTKVHFLLGFAWGYIGNLNSGRLLMGLQIGHHELGVLFSTSEYEKDTQIASYDYDKFFGSHKYEHQSYTPYYGYRFNISRRFVVTPKVGATYAIFSNPKDNEKSSDLNAWFGHIGCSLLLTWRLIGICVTPEWNFRLSQGDGYKQYASSPESGADIGGLGISAGLLISF